MSKFNYSHNNFTAGQLSQRLQGRIDIQEYKNGCETLENMIPFKQGGVTRRPGTALFKIPAAAGDFRTAHMLFIDYIYSKTVAYLICIDTKTRAYKVYQNNGTDVTATLFSGSLPLIASEMDMYGFDWVQVGYYLILVHNSGTQLPIIFKPTFSNAGALATITVVGYVGKYYNIPYLAPNITTTTLDPSATTGSITLVSSAAFFNAGHIGTYFLLKHSNTWGVVLITGYTNTTTVSGTVMQTLGADTATDNWREGAWSTTQGFPTCVTFYEGRVVFGGTKQKPDTLFFSMADNLEFMMQQRFVSGAAPASPPLLVSYTGDPVTSDPLMQTIGGNQANIIVWIIPGRSLHVGTLGEEYVISFDSGAVSANVLDDGVPTVRPITSYGSSPLKPVKLGDTTIFVTRDGRKLRAISYVEENGSFVSSDLNILADDVIEYNAASTVNFAQIQIKQIVYQASRNIVWVLVSTGELLGVTLSEDGKVFAWHTHEIGGYSNSAKTINSKIISMAVLPNSTGSYDELYLYVNRFMSGVDAINAQYFIEKMAQDFTGTDMSSSVSYPLGLDSCLPQSPPGDTTLPNLTMYEGETLSVIADGNYVGDFLVNASGEITLPAVYTNHVYTGYKFTSTLKTMDLEAGGDFGVAMGLLKRIDRAFVKLYKSRGFKIGTSGNNQIDATFSDSTVLYNGDKKLVVNHSPEEPGNIIVAQENPYPLTVLAIAVRGVTYD